MKIEVTGCNNCPFANILSLLPYCNLFRNGKQETQEPDVCDDDLAILRDTLPQSCPITLNGGEITIKTKTE